MELSDRTLGMVVNKLSPSEDERPAKWKGSGSLSKNLIISPKEPYVVLGPGQVQPKGYRLTSGRYGELKLGFLKIKGTIEVEVRQKPNIHKSSIMPQNRMTKKKQPIIWHRLLEK